MTSWDRLHRGGDDDEFLDDDVLPSPGKASLTSRLPRGTGDRTGGSEYGYLMQSTVQRRAEAPGGSSADDPFAIHVAAEHGLQGAAQPLPYLAQIQASFGPDHDVSHIRAHTGGGAAEATQMMGATAYARGDQVAFGGAPSLHTAAHEAAHVVQQRSGVHLAGGVGQAGDPYEQHADAVADRVVRGESAADLLQPYAGGRGASAAVQLEPGWWPFRKAGGIIVSPGGPVQVPDNRPRPKTTATEYLKTFGKHHAEELPRLLEEMTFTLPSPYVTWDKASSAKGFAHDVGADIKRKVDADPVGGFASTVVPANVYEVVDKARDADTHDQPQQADEYHQSVGLALANVYRDRITESLARVLPRYVNEWNRKTLEQQGEMSKRNNGADIPEHPETAIPGVGIQLSHPIDWSVAGSLSIIGFSRLTPNFALYRKDHPSETKVTARHERRPVKAFTWQHDKGASNWIKVTDPLGATVEEVAHELYGEDTFAFKITAAPPLFGLEPMGLKPEYYKQLHAHGGGTSPELRPGGGAHTLPQQILSGPLADEVALDQARGFKKDKLPAGGLDQYFDQLITHFKLIEPMAVKIDGNEQVVAARQRVEQRKQKAGDDAGQAELWGAQAREQLDVVVRCYEGMGRTDRMHAATAKQPIGNFEGKLLHDHIGRIYMRAAASSDMVVTARGMVDDADKQVKVFVVDWLDEVFRWLRGALLNSRFNKRTGNIQDPKLQVGELDQKEAAIQRDLHHLRDTLLNRPDDIDKEINAAYQKLSDMSVEVSLIRDIDACDAAWKQLKGSKSTMGWIRGLAPGDHGNEKLENLQGEADAFDATWNQILADWRSGKRDEAVKAMEDAHNKAAWKSFFERVAHEIRDQAEIDKLMTFVAMIGVAVLSGGIGQVVGAAVGGGVLGFTLGLAAEVTVFTALSYAIVDKEHSVAGFWSQWKKNLGVFLLLRGVSAAFKGMGGESQLGEVMLQYATINGMALWEANQEKHKHGKGSLTISEVLEISLENLMFVVGASIGSALVQPWVSKLALRGAIGARIREADALHQRVQKLADRVQSSKGKDVAAAHELMKQQHDLLEKQTKIVEDLARFADNAGAAKDAGISDTQLAKIREARGDLDTAKKQLDMVKLFSQLEPVSSGSYLIARDGSIDGAHKTFESQRIAEKPTGEGEPGGEALEGVAKVGTITADPASKTRSFEVTMSDGTTFKVSERVGKTEDAVPEGSAPDLGPAVEPAGGELGTAGRNVYRVPFNEATKRSKGEKVIDPKRVLKIVTDMIGIELMHGAQLSAKRGTLDTFIITIPGKAKGTSVELEVKVRVREADNAMWEANQANAPHGGDFGPARLSNLKEVNGKWTAEVDVNAGLHSEDVPRTVQHEMNEAADLLHNNPRASEADIKRESQAGVFGSDPNAKVTSHDRSSSRELKSLHEALMHAQEAHKPDQVAIADAQAKVDRMLRAMNLDGGTLSPEQLATLRDAGIRGELIADIQGNGPNNRRDANYGRNVSDTREAQPFMSASGGQTAAGHARSKHYRDAASLAKVLDVLNNAANIFTGTYEASGRHVDVYWAKDSIVVTEVGQKDVIITAYGPAIDGGGPVPLLKFRSGGGYREVTR